MGRRKSSPADDIFDLVAMLPWWGGVALAAAADFVLHAIAAQPAVISGSGGQLGASVVSAMWKGLANIGQYLLPVICLFAAIGSALGRRKRMALVDGVDMARIRDARR